MNIITNIRKYISKISLESFIILFFLCIVFFHFIGKYLDVTESMANARSISEEDEDDGEEKDKKKVVLNKKDKKNTLSVDLRDFEQRIKMLEKKDLGQRVTRIEDELKKQEDIMVKQKEMPSDEDFMKQAEESI